MACNNWQLNGSIFTTTLSVVTGNYGSSLLIAYTSATSKTTNFTSSYWGLYFFNDIFNLWENGGYA